MPLAMLAPGAVTWFAVVREWGPYLPSVALVAATLLCGLLASAAGRRLGCPPVVREHLHAGRHPEGAYQSVLEEARRAGLRIDFQEPGIRLAASEGGAGGHYQRLAKRIEIRFTEREEGTLAAATVVYLPIIVVDTGEGRYAADLGARLVGAPREAPGGHGYPLSLGLAAVAAAVATAAMAYLRLVDPAAWLPLAFEANTAILTACILSAMALAQTASGRSLLRGRTAALGLLGWSLLLLAAWTALYLLWV